MYTYVYIPLIKDPLCNARRIMIVLTYLTHIVTRVNAHVQLE